MFGAASLSVGLVGPMKLGVKAGQIIAEGPKGASSRIAA